MHLVYVAKDLNLSNLCDGIKADRILMFWIVLAGDILAMFLVTTLVTTVVITRRFLMQSVFMLSLL